MRACLRGVAYFLIVFTVGFALGIVRVAWAAPRIGERWAELAEMPVMLVAIIVAARCVDRRWPAGRRSERLLSGAVALLLLVGVELTVVLSLRGLTVGQYLAERDPVAGSAYGLMLLVFALMPWAAASRPPGAAMGGTGGGASGRG